MPAPISQPPPVERKSAVEAMAESAARPLDFNPAERSQILKENLRKVLALQDAGATTAEIKDAVPDLVEQFPELYKKITTPGEDLTPLLGMLDMLDKIGAGSITHHNASVVVGQALASKYMPANLRAEADAAVAAAAATSKK
jgi:hypothetical protein